MAGRLELLRSNRVGFVPEPYETEQVRKDGTTLWTETVATPVFNDEGQLIALQGVTRDITERKRAEEELRNQKQVMEVILDNVPAMMVFYDAQGHCRYVNRCLQETLGWSQEELGSHNLLEECYPDPNYRDYVVNYIDSAKGTWGDFSTLTRYGHQLDTSWANLALPDGSGIGIGIDITERRRAEEALRLSEEKFSKAFFLSPDAISVSRLVDGMLVSVNEGFKQIFGYAEEEVIGKTSLELGIWDKPEHRNRWTEKLKAEGMVDNFETCFHTKDGDIRYGLMSASIIVLNGVEHILNVTRDITERKRGEEALRESEERWQFALEGARDGVWDWNAQTNEVFFSRQWKAMLGYEEHEIGNTLDEWDKRVHTDDKESCYGDLERHFSGETPFYENEHRVLCKDGNYKWILDRGKVMEWMDDGKPLRVIGTHMDMTDRKRAEQEKENLRAQLLQSQKMETMGTLAAGIAHDFNNMLAIILGYSDMLLADKNERDPGYEELRKILKGTSINYSGNPGFSKILCFGMI
ncbi:MAG: PAS domain S-box protein [Deltaproteobacteria bacterium]|nr:PAS domain S-box protein [Deltaproteobacteria bacterium]